MDNMNIIELSREAISFEMYSDDNFGMVLKKYMVEQNLSVSDLAMK